MKLRHARTFAGLPAPAGRARGFVLVAVLTLVMLASMVAVSLLFGNGDGTLGMATPDVPIGYTAWRLLIRDLNSDGEPDLLTGGTNKVSVRLGLGGGVFGPGSDYASNWAGVTETADLDGDGDLDLATGSSQVSVLLGNGSGGFGPKADYSNGGYSPRDLAITDVNSDGRQDLLFTVEHGTRMMLGTGGGAFGTSTSV
jgi:hypothetical protein